MTVPSSRNSRTHLFHSERSSQRGPEQIDRKPHLAAHILCVGKFAIPAVGSRRGASLCVLWNCGYPACPMGGCDFLRSTLSTREKRQYGPKRDDQLRNHPSERVKSELFVIAIRRGVATARPPIAADDRLRANWGLPSPRRPQHKDVFRQQQCTRP